MLLYFGPRLGQVFVVATSSPLQSEHCCHALLPLLFSMCLFCCPSPPRDSSWHHCSKPPLVVCFRIMVVVFILIFFFVVGRVQHFCIWMELVGGWERVCWSDGAC